MKKSKPAIQEKKERSDRVSYRNLKTSANDYHAHIHSRVPFGVLILSSAAATSSRHIPNSPRLISRKNFLRSEDGQELNEATTTNFETAAA